MKLDMKKSLRSGMVLSCLAGMPFLAGCGSNKLHINTILNLSFSQGIFFRGNIVSFDRFFSSLNFPLLQVDAHTHAQAKWDTGMTNGLCNDRFISDWLLVIT